MDRTEAAQALRGRTTVEAMEESEASLERGKDECERHAKTRERVAWESASGGKVFRAKGGGIRGQRSCQIHQVQIQEQRNLGHGRSEAEVRVGIFDSAGPRLGDRHETGCETWSRERS